MGLDQAGHFLVYALVYYAAINRFVRVLPVLTLLRFLLMIVVRGGHGPVGGTQIVYMCSASGGYFEISGRGLRTLRGLLEAEPWVPWAKYKNFLASHLWDMGRVTISPSRPKQR